ncbi:putative mitochondrial protein [Cucumis melo var. makuwa]|uniref:Mitochondrial protein n=1 Tax=Cucumis melo var. makuwa TaxID=1194695 RepID=A0A5A7VE86_CUCMM|nr:putative mitochondrial protein [Cucumis melo var. makuwa]TYK07161.1 putative mitochondrial protein [Cucumis melo var. makuwa]
MIKKFGIDKAKAKRTPTTSHLKVSKDDSGDKIYESLYRSIIRSPLYLTASRHDIAYVVGDNVMLIGIGVLKIKRDIRESSSTSFKAAYLKSFVSMHDEFVASTNVLDSSPFASSHKISSLSKSSLKNTSRVPMSQTTTNETVNIDSNSFDDDDHFALSEFLRHS